LDLVCHLQKKKHKNKIHVTKKWPQKEGDDDDDDDDDDEDIIAVIDDDHLY